MKTLSARASIAVFRAANEPMVSSSVGLPVPGEGEIIVKVTCCTICGIDLQTIQGARVTPMPPTLGHEILGVVSALPPRPPLDELGSPLRLGTRITWSVGASCGTCRGCQQGIPQKCNRLFKYGHQSLADCGELSGGFAEYCLLSAGIAIVPVPETRPDEVATPANCATATVMAAMRTAGSLQGKKVLVLGTSMLGLTWCAAVSAQHAAHVHACDQNPMRLAKASAFGASKIIPSVSDDDYDCVFEMSGHHLSVKMAIEAAGVGGVVVLVGSASSSAPVLVDPERSVRQLISIHGVHNYRSDDLRVAIEFLLANHNQYPFASLVEKSFSLTEINDAISFAFANQPILVSIVPQNSIGNRP